jgi:hypothetical protein
MQIKRECNLFQRTNNRSISTDIFDVGEFVLEDGLREICREMTSFCRNMKSVTTGFSISKSERVAKKQRTYW